MNFHPSFQVLRGNLLYYLMTSYCIPNAEPSLEGNSKIRKNTLECLGPKEPWTPVGSLPRLYRQKVEVQRSCAVIVRTGHPGNQFRASRKTRCPRFHPQFLPVSPPRSSVGYRCVGGEEGFRKGLISSASTQTTSEFLRSLILQIRLCGTEYFM